MIRNANDKDANIDMLVDGFHLYTLNLEQSPTQILIDLDAADSIMSCSASPSVLFERTNTKDMSQSDNTNLQNNHNGTHRKERGGPHPKY
jgi:hypothetical protein